MTNIREALLGATTTEEVKARTEAYAAANGVRLPTIYEVMDGFFQVFKVAGMDQQARLILAMAAGQYTRETMAKNDTKAATKVEETAVDGVSLNGFSGS